jgi:hypothetical protein
MKRLIKADYYDEYGFFKKHKSKEDLEKEYRGIAEFYCESFGVSPNTIQIDYFASNTSISFGNVKEDGFEIGVDFYNEKDINRITVFCGKDRNGKSHHIETRDQAILDLFLREDRGFYEWADNALEELADKYI